MWIVREGVYFVSLPHAHLALPIFTPSWIFKNYFGFLQVLGRFPGAVAEARGRAQSKPPPLLKGSGVARLGSPA